jgi:hypothetical protein
MRGSVPGISQIGDRCGDEAANEGGGRSTLTGDDLAAVSDACPVDDELTRDDRGSGQVEPDEPDEPGVHY